MVSVDDRATGPHSSESRAADHERLVLEPRDVEFDWTNLPFHYVPNEPMATHVLNVLHMLLPAGEEFFVRVFKKTLPLIKDDQLRLDVQGFIGQEAMHSQAHSGVVDHFDAQGVDVTAFTNQIRWLFEKLLGESPRRSPRRQYSWLLEQVSFIAAIEHYTAVMGEWILNSPQLDAVGADPVMLDMLRWHGAEEVEHKAVPRHHEALARRLLAAGACPADRYPGDVAAVDSRSAVHVFGGSVPATGDKAALAGLFQGRTPWFGARAAAAASGRGALLQAGFSPVPAGRAGGGRGLPGRLARRASVALIGDDP